MFAAKFKDHDLVFLGEAAARRQAESALLQKLIPSCIKPGIHNLGYE